MECVLPAAGRRDPIADVPSIEAEAARRSLHEFVRQAWSVLEPGVDFVDGWHLDAICLHLQAVSGYDCKGNALPLGKRIRKLIINVPFRSSKSVLTSVCWCPWEWITAPWTQWLFLSHSEELVLKHAADRRRLIESDWYQSNWGPKSPWGRLHPDKTFTFRKEETALGRYSNSRNGYCISRPMTGVTGFGANRCVIDDGNDAQRAESDAMRNQVNSTFDNSIISRQNNFNTDAFVCIQQRTHEDDLSGHLLAKGGWEHLCIPKEYDGRDLIDLDAYKVQHATSTRQIEHRA